MVATARLLIVAHLLTLKRPQKMTLADVYVCVCVSTAYLLIVAYLLTLKRPQKMTIADVQTTFMGMFYVGYLSSFWVRLRALGAIPSEQVQYSFNRALTRASIEP